MRHWIIEIAENIKKRARAKGKKKIVVNGGLSVSGLQHIGRLRGEVLIGDGVAKILKSTGLDVQQYIVLYTQDAWKATSAQRAVFKDNPEKYQGWPLIKVPDPHGCHSNWVEHYWEDFGGVLDKFTWGKIKIIDTTSLYRGPLKPIVKEAIEKREELREIINRYRGRNPLPQNWYPFEPICEGCGRIDKTRVLSVDNGYVRYQCDNCGHIGTASISEGKLNWRVEWAGVWKALSIDFEPYGKDHATPGGSRDSCNEIAERIFGIEPPDGVPYEWVALRQDGVETDMSSSGFSGITPREWLRIAEAEVLRYLFYLVPPKRKIVVDLTEIPGYYNMYYEGEDLFYRKMNGEHLSEEEEYKAETYYLSQIKEPAQEKPVQIPYLTMALLSQSIPPDMPERTEIAIRRLRSSGLLKKEIKPIDKERIEKLLETSYNWATLYAPKSLRYRVLETLPKEVLGRLKYREKLAELGHRLVSLDKWSEEDVKKVMIEHTRDMSRAERKEFYREFYMVIVGRESGPRAAPLVAILGKEFIKKRLLEDLQKE